MVGSSTDFTSIAKEIGGDRIRVYAPLPGYQEPELYIEEVFPSWIIQASRADGYVRIGLFADVWADSLMIDARNPRIDPGAPGARGRLAGHSRAGNPDRPGGPLAGRDSPAGATRTTCWTR